MKLVVMPNKMWGLAQINKNEIVWIMFLQQNFYFFSKNKTILWKSWPYGILVCDKVFHLWTCYFNSLYNF